jgi:fatty acid-binding protein DegV
MLAVAQQFWDGSIERFPLGPVVGTHTGPGAAGIAAIVKAPHHAGSAA